MFFMTELMFLMVFILIKAMIYVNVLCIVFHYKSFITTNKQIREKKSIDKKRKENIY